MKSSHKKHEIKGKGNVITEFMKEKTTELSKGEKTLLACGGPLWKERNWKNDSSLFLLLISFFLKYKTT